MTGDPGARPHALASFLPLGFDATNRVVLRQCPLPPFGEPFLVQTLAALPDDAPTTRLDVESLLRLQPSLPAPPLILHTGRCGSTLLCRLLDASGVVATFREPSAPVTAVDLPNAPGRALRAVLTQFAWAAQAAGRVPVVKLSSYATRVLDDLVSAEVPRVFVVRDALPVVARVLDDPPGWLLEHYPSGWLDRERPDGWTGNGFSGPDALDVADQQRLLDRSADHWAAIVDAAFAAQARSGALLVDFEGLVADPAGVTRAVLDHLGIDGEVPPGALDGVLSRHAKSGAVLDAVGQPPDPPALDVGMEERLAARVARPQRELHAWRAARAGADTPEMVDQARPSGRLAR